MKSMCLGHTENYEWSVSEINRKIREKERNVYERRDQRKRRKARKEEEPEKNEQEKENK